MFPEQTNPLSPIGQVVIFKVDKLRHSWFIQMLLVPHLVPSSTSPGFTTPGEGVTKYDLFNEFQIPLFFRT